jgi:hypothetical protein
MAGTKPTMRGRFLPKNPQKYVGNVHNILFRSSWEVTFMKWLDTNNAVLRWGSEELAIPYVNPIKLDQDGRPKVCRYFPDFIMMYQDSAGNIKKEIIEVKPYKESVITPGMTERDKMAYAVNQAKWKAAAAFAEAQGATFRVITEKTIYKNGGQARSAPKARKAMGTNV